MSASREDLLQPSLSGEGRPAAAPYSVGTTFLSGFFGGPFGAIAILATNSVRLRRMSRDAPVWIALLVLSALGIWALHQTAQGADIRAWIDGRLGERSQRFVYRICALLIVGVGYFLHRREQRSTDLTGLTRPNGWIAGIACIVLGSLLLAGYVAMLTR